MNRKDILQKFIDKYQYKSYLEIGLAGGWLFNQINIPFKESVDPALGQYKDSKPTYKMTSDKFFLSYPHKKYDIIFIDGLHESHQVDKDIKNSLKALNKGGKILLHDCSPESKEDQIIPRQKSGVWNGDVWKSFVKFNAENYKNYNMYVINTDFGVGVIEKGKGKFNLQIPTLLEYEWFNENRIDALNLISIQEFNSQF